MRRQGLQVAAGGGEQVVCVYELPEDRSGLGEQGVVAEVCLRSARVVAVGIEAFRGGVCVLPCGSRLRTDEWLVAFVPWTVFLF